MRRVFPQNNWCFDCKTILRLHDCGSYSVAFVVGPYLGATPSWYELLVSLEVVTDSVKGLLMPQIHNLISQSAHSAQARVFSRRHM